MFLLLPHSSHYPSGEHKIIISIQNGPFYLSQPWTHVCNFCKYTYMYICTDTNIQYTDISVLIPLNIMIKTITMFVL